MKNVLLKLTECPLSTFQTFTGINQKIGLFILTDEYETQYNSSAARIKAVHSLSVFENCGQSVS